MQNLSSATATNAAMTVMPDELRLFVKRLCIAGQYIASNKGTTLMNSKALRDGV